MSIANPSIGPVETCLLIPGVDAIESPIQRRALFQFPRVSHHLKQTQEVLMSHGIPLNLESLMLEDNVSSTTWLHHLIVATLPVHLALYESFLALHGPPDVVMSCSLGDISRNACLGLTDLETSVLGIHQFALRAAQIRTGAVFRLRTNVGLFSEQDFSDIESHGVWVSVYQTPKQVLVAGEKTKLEEWTSSPAFKHQEWDASLLYPIPLHTPLMQPCVDGMNEFIDRARIHASSTQVYSAVSRKWLVTPEDFRSDILINIGHPVQWFQSIHDLSSQFSQMTFINLGPTPTLSKFVQKTIPDPLRVTDFYSELIHAAV